MFTFGKICRARDKPTACWTNKGFSKGSFSPGNRFKTGLKVYFYLDPAEWLLFFSDFYVSGIIAPLEYEICSFGRTSAPIF